MELVITTRARKTMKRLEKSNKDILNKILDSIKEFVNEPNAKFDLKRLKGEYEGYQRLRVGDYRVFFYIENDTMIVSEIKHRQGAY